MVLPLGALTGTLEMPLCRSGQPAPTRAPDAPPSLGAPGTCRARVTATQRVSGVVPEPGYHHLGATTSDKWSGVLGRIEVVDAAVRTGTYDFLAARFMAKGEVGGRTAWLEAGWTETGWSGGGKQRLYTYDTNRQSWTFYDGYQLKPGDRVWIYLQTEQATERPVWEAWLWWGDSWHLLTSQALPIGPRAMIEQYVEVHTEQPFQVPQVRVDSVDLKDGPAGQRSAWGTQVPTAPGVTSNGYCLTWISRYDHWSAGSCTAG